MKNITHKVVNSVTDIGKDDWDSVFGDIPEGYQFYKAIEESGLEDFTFYYISLYQEDTCLLIAPLFIADFNLDIAVSGVMEKIIRLIRRFSPGFLVLKTLFCGSPFREHGILGIRKAVEDKEGLINELIKVVDKFSAVKGASFIIFKDFLGGEPLLPASLGTRGFFKVKSFPSAVTELNFNSFDEYLSSLGHSTRKSLRRKLKKAYSQADIMVKIVDRADDLIDDLHRLYVNTYHNGATKFEKLTKEFFINAGRDLYPHAKFFLYYVNGKLGAFNLCFVYKDLFIDKFIGFDYDISNQYSLYFVSWCFNIEWCIKNSIRSYQSGQTDYCPKARLGGKLIPLYAYLKHKNPVVNSLFKLLAVFLRPENFDQDIRDAEHV
ncbi:MAG: GNAT family N-acetyltransferase [Candidatus Omnitrophota bacterium]